MEILLEGNRINEKLKVEKNSLLIFTIVFIGLAFIFSYGMDNVAAANVIYVNSSHGNDAWSGNSWATAKHTIKNAVGTVTNKGAIYIAPGKYNEHGIDIKKNLTITGLNQKRTIINAQKQDRIFLIRSGSIITMKCLTLTNGTGEVQGGAIWNDGVGLSVINCSFTNNFATPISGLSSSDYGGAICSEGTLTVINSYFANNNVDNVIGAGEGGAIWSDNAIINSSTFTNNTGAYGGAIYNNLGSIMTVTGSIFTNNHAKSYNTYWNIGHGGAIYNDGYGIPGTLTVINNIFTGNTATDYIDNIAGDYGTGGAICNNEGTLTAHFNQFVGDTAIQGKEIDNDGGTAIATSNWWGSNSNPTSKVYGGVSVTPWELYVTPKITSTYPKNGATKVSRTLPIYVKFNELIKTSTNWSKIYVKDKYGHAVSISKSISGNTLYIQTSKRLSNSYYTVYIPSAAIKNYAGNNLIANYTFKFKTGP